MFPENCRRLPTALVGVKQRILPAAPEVYPVSRIRDFRAVEVEERAGGVE
jgi:hypothetical protein